jgi:hypothetical protein
MIVAIHYLFGRYARPIHWDNAGAPVPDDGVRRSPFARIDTVGFLDLVGVTFARGERSVCMRHTRCRVDAEGRDAREPSGL